MNIEFTKAELDIVVQLMDVGVKSVGLNAMRTELLNVISKFANAVKESETPKEEVKED